MPFFRSFVVATRVSSLLHCIWDALILPRGTALPRRQACRTDHEWRDKSAPTALMTFSPASSGVVEVVSTTTSARSWHRA